MFRAKKLDPAVRIARLKFAEKYCNEPVDFWENVEFVDEMRFR